MQKRLLIVAAALSCLPVSTPVQAKKQTEFERVLQQNGVSYHKDAPIVTNTVLQEQFLQTVAALKGNEAALEAFLVAYMPLFQPVSAGLDMASFNADVEKLLARKDLTGPQQRAVSAFTELASLGLATRGPSMGVRTKRSLSGTEQGAIAAGAVVVVGALAAVVTAAVKSRKGGKGGGGATTTVATTGSTTGTTSSLSSGGDLSASALQRQQEQERKQAQAQEALLAGLQKALNRGHLYVATDGAGKVQLMAGDDSGAASGEVLHRVDKITGNQVMGPKAQGVEVTEEVARERAKAVMAEHKLVEHLKNAWVQQGADQDKCVAWLEQALTDYFMGVTKPLKEIPGAGTQEQLAVQNLLNRAHGAVNRLQNWWKKRTKGPNLAQRVRDWLSGFGSHADRMAAIRGNLWQAVMNDLADSDGKINGQVMALSAAASGDFTGDDAEAEKAKTVAEIESLLERLRPVWELPGAADAVAGPPPAGAPSAERTFVSKVLRWQSDLSKAFDTLADKRRDSLFQESQKVGDKVEAAFSNVSAADLVAKRYGDEVKAALEAAEPAVQKMKVYASNPLEVTVENLLTRLKQERATALLPTEKAHVEQLRGECANLLNKAFGDVTADDWKQIEAAMNAAAVYKELRVLAGSGDDLADWAQCEGKMGDWAQAWADDVTKKIDAAENADDAALDINTHRQDAFREALAKHNDQGDRVAHAITQRRSHIRFKAERENDLCQVETHLKDCFTLRACVEAYGRGIIVLSGEAYTGQSEAVRDAREDLTKALGQLADKIKGVVQPKDDRLLGAEVKDLAADHVDWKKEYRERRRLFDQQYTALTAFLTMEGVAADRKEYFGFAITAQKAFLQKQFGWINARLNHLLAQDELDADRLKSVAENYDDLLEYGSQANETLELPEGTADIVVANPYAGAINDAVDQRLMEWFDTTNADEITGAQAAFAPGYKFAQAEDREAVAATVISTNALLEAMSAVAKALPEEHEFRRAVEVFAEQWNEVKDKELPEVQGAGDDSGSGAPTTTPPSSPPSTTRPTGDLASPARALPGFNFSVDPKVAARQQVLLSEQATVAEKLAAMQNTLHNLTLNGERRTALGIDAATDLTAPLNAAQMKVLGQENGGADLAAVHAALAGVEDAIDKARSKAELDAAVEVAQQFRNKDMIAAIYRATTVKEDDSWVDDSAQAYVKGLVSRSRKRSALLESEARTAVAANFNQQCQNVAQSIGVYTARSLYNVKLIEGLERQISKTQGMLAKTAFGGNHNGFAVQLVAHDLNDGHAVLRGALAQVQPLLEAAKADQEAAQKQVDGRDYDRIVGGILSNPTETTSEELASAKENLGAVARLIEKKVAGAKLDDREPTQRTIVGLPLSTAQIEALERQQPLLQQRIAQAEQALAHRAQAEREQIEGQLQERVLSALIQGQAAATTGCQDLTEDKLATADGIVKAEGVLAQARDILTQGGTASEDLASGGGAVGVTLAASETGEAHIALKQAVAELAARIDAAKQALDDAVADEDADTVAAKKAELVERVMGFFTRAAERLNELTTEKLNAPDGIAEAERLRDIAAKNLTAQLDDTVTLADGTERPVVVKATDPEVAAGAAACQQAVAELAARIEAAKQALAADAAEKDERRAQLAEKKKTLAAQLKEQMQRSKHIDEAIKAQLAEAQELTKRHDEALAALTANARFACEPLDDGGFDQPLARLPEDGRTAELVTAFLDAQRRVDGTQFHVVDGAKKRRERLSRNAPAYVQSCRVEEGEYAEVWKQSFYGGGSELDFAGMDGLEGFDKEGLKIFFAWLVAQREAYAKQSVEAADLRRAAEEANARVEELTRQSREVAAEVVALQAALTETDAELAVLDAPLTDVSGS